MTALLEARDVSLSYGKIEAVRQVSLTVEPNQIVTVIGPNGAGKSSLLRALMGALPHTGTIRYVGADWSRRALEDRAEPRVVWGAVRAADRRSVCGAVHGQRREPGEMRRNV